MSKEKSKKSKKQNGGKIVLLLIIIIIAVAAILLFGKGGFGLGGGSGEGVPAGGTIPVMSDSPETVPDTATESEQTNASGEDEEGQQGSRVIIEVAEDKIFADGSVCVDTAVLRDYLLGAAGEDTEFILRDSHAVKSVYDEAKGVLDELGYEYTVDVVE
ncbi:MAG: hypothetical protein K2K57_04775 [Oscillospiraceae bacterium]|nr:hypothetical protein [Oscillospiraceae bacterium]